MPKTIIRLAAGRYQFNETEQAMVSAQGHEVTVTWGNNDALLNGWLIRFGSDS